MPSFATVKQGSCTTERQCGGAHGLRSLGFIIRLTSANLRVFLALPIVPRCLCSTLVQSWLGCSAGPCSKVAWLEGSRWAAAAAAAVAAASMATAPCGSALTTSPLFDAVGSGAWWAAEYTQSAAHCHSAPDKLCSA